MEEQFSAEILNQARIITERLKYWTPDIEKLLRRWRKQINNRHFEHKEAERKYTKFYYLLGVPTTILSTIVSSGVLTTFQNCNLCTEQCSIDASTLCASDEYIRLAMGIIGIISVVLTAVMIFLNYGAASVDNKNASADYGELVREIDSIVETPILARTDPIVSLHQIRTKFDDIAKNSPSLNSPVSLEYKNFKKEKSSLGSPGVQRQKSKMPNASSLAKILVNKIQEENENDVKILQQIQDTNDFNTDDDKDVAIALDIEKIRPGDTIENTRRNAMEESLAKALEFELARFYIPEKTTKRKKKHNVIHIGPKEDSIPLEDDSKDDSKEKGEFL